MFFFLESTGHNLEYLHHEYIGASLDYSNQYVFCVPKDVQEKMHLFEWKQSNNICFDFYVPPLGNGMSLIRATWRKYKAFRVLLDKHKPQQVFINYAYPLLPWVLLLKNKTLHLSCIVYKVYLYTWRTDSWKRKLKSLIEMAIYRYSTLFEHVFILNDSAAAQYLNRKWHTEKFRYLPDPYMGIAVPERNNLRQELGIKDNETVILHIGSMSEIKGTLNILNMIQHSEEADLVDLCFIFAGKINNDISDKFYSKYKTLKHKVHIIIEDDFLSYERMASYMQIADKVVLPYNVTNASSGIIAYCAQFGKPVYVPNKGMLSKLVRKYKIGVTVPSFDSVNCLNKDYCNNSNYCDTHTVEIFYKTIINGFK